MEKWLFNIELEEIKLRNKKKESSISIKMIK